MRSYSVRYLGENIVQILVHNKAFILSPIIERLGELLG